MTDAETIAPDSTDAQAAGAAFEALAQQTHLDSATVATIAERLDAMDRSRAWTRDALHAIDDDEHATVEELAQQLEREVLRLKTDMRRLRALALTERTDAGYRLTPRGIAFLAADDTARTS